MFLRMPNCQSSLLSSKLLKMVDILDTISRATLLCCLLIAFNLIAIMKMTLIMLLNN